MRDLVVLGTSSQVPTRHRNHNGYLLRWDGEGVLFDPGEGTQRQMTYAGVSAASITRICITHLHGDHCLGLPGVLQRFALDGVRRPVDVYFPAAGLEFVERLRHASLFDDTSLDVRLHPIERGVDGPIAECEQFTLHAVHLDHGPDTIGYRVEEPDGRRMDRAALDARGISGAAVARLRAQGQLVLDNGDVVHVDDVSEPRPGQVFSFVMDTRVCEAAHRLAAGADLLVAEATFADADAGLAQDYGHLTARQAGEIAQRAGVRCLVLTHFSQRYRDIEPLLAEAREVFPDVVAANDLDRIELPKRR
ncbi:MAG TPA: ribonuclease Z [Acidimicrobiales bacterium]|nr:ribonuclease Z [Acidimicrobiales bacterium]